MATNSNIKGIESGRAKQAFDYVQKVINFYDKKYFEKFLENRLIKEKYPKEQQKRDCIKLFLEGKICSNNTIYEEIEKLKQSFLKEYKSYVRKVPVYIKTNGLAATFAFALSKGKKQPSAWDIIYKQTEEWLTNQDKIGKGDLMKELLSLNSFKYRIATKETLTLFNWLRRFADGLIEGEAND